jgi:CRP-like cAMP-binding protein
MSNDRGLASVHAGRALSGLQRALRQLPEGGSEQRAVEAGEIDAVIDYGNSNVIVFPAARRALREQAKRAAAAERKATLAVPVRNSVLAALPRAEYQRLLPGLEPVRLEFGDVLHEAGAPIGHVYFPVDCVVCLLTKIDDERAIATGLIGSEGMVGMPLALDVGVSSVRAMVQVAGTALRMPATRFLNELQRGLQLQRHLHRHAQANLDQSRQIAACSASHYFEQRLACWLLMVRERAPSQQMYLTHEHLAAVLNVRRESVTEASGSLRARGLIGYSRGRLSILDHKGLASASCGCHRPTEVDAVAWRVHAPESQTPRRAGMG